jgi:hypothetical protein
MLLETIKRSLKRNKKFIDLYALKERKLQKKNHNDIATYDGFGIDSGNHMSKRT